MPAHVVAAVEDFPEGSRRLVTVDGRKIVVFNVGGQFYGLLDRCPHQGGSLSRGTIGAAFSSPEPGRFDVACRNVLVRCPWHGWQYDLRTGQSWSEPGRLKTRAYTIEVEEGGRLAAGPYAAETVDVAVEGRYVVVKT
jgi:3-phenylpropionate/trans-cinnamate dioxygenase ferredoxin subunit